MINSGRALVQAVPRCVHSQQEHVATAKTTRPLSSFAVWVYATGALRIQSYDFAIKHGIVRHSHKSFGDGWVSSAEIVFVLRAELDFAALF
jgi:hypothetical protein